MNYLTTHKKQLIALLVVLPLIGLGVYLALNQTLLRSRASQGSVSFSSQNINAAQNQSFVVNLMVNPNGASAVGASAEVNFNTDFLDITPGDITKGTFGEVVEKTVEKNGSSGKVKVSAVNFNNQAQNYHTPTQVATVFATLTFKTKSSAGNTSLSLGDLLVVAPGNNQTIAVDKGGVANITISGTSTPVASGPSVPNVVACTLSANSTSGGLNDTFTFTLSSPTGVVDAGIPSGSTLAWGGTNNGTAITPSSAGTFSSAPQVVGSFKGSDFGGAGTYARFITITRNGSQICQTIPVTVTVTGAGAVAAPTAQLFYFTQAGATQESLRVKRTALSGSSVLQNGGVADVKATNIVFPTGAASGNNAAIWVVQANNDGTAPASNTNFSCTSPNSSVTAAGVKYCGIGNPNIAAGATTGRVNIRDWNPQQAGTYKIFVEAIDANGKKCSGWQTAFNSTHPEAGVTRCSSDGNDALTLIVTQPAGGASSTLAATVANSTQGEPNETASGNVGVSFPAGKFVASAFVPNNSSDNITATGMYIVKVDPITRVPVANPTWSCNVPAGVLINGTSTTSPVINVTDTTVPASFRTRYCVIADGVSGQKQFLDIRSKVFSVSEVGTYIVFMDANAGTTASPNALSCSGAPWGTLPGKTRCETGGGDSVTVTVTTAAVVNVKSIVDQIIADYGLLGSLTGDYNKDGKVNSLDFAFQVYKGN